MHFVGFGWDNFLHRGWYGAVVRICTENSIEYAGIFKLLLSMACTEQRPFLLLIPPLRGLGVYKLLGRDAARTDDPN